MLNGNEQLINVELKDCVTGVMSYDQEITLERFADEIWVRLRERMEKSKTGFLILQVKKQRVEDAEVYFYNVRWGTKADNR